MENAIIQFSQQDCLEVERIVLDCDEQAALALVKDIRQRIRNQKNISMKNHIDGR